MKNESRIVRKKWICVYGSYYTAPALAAHTGAEVQVWFEEEDLSRILVYTKQEEFICVALISEKANNEGRGVPMKSALNKVLEAIDGLPALDALKTLNNAVARLLDKEGSDNKQELVFDTTDNHTSRLLDYSSVGRSKIRKDPELRDYIHDIARSMMLDEIHQACVERFGKERVPSRSSINRYLQKLRRELRKGEGV